ncbi:MAG TPA: glycosyltransferase [Micromonosporaceae bacterium]|nr:glycosyltransferase [Micromonosporaceae bacterium]
MTAPPLVLVVVGTDVHPFDRLTSWLERWSPGPARLLVQYGHGRRPALAGATAFLDHDELRRVMTEAALVVSHGGPATITEARRTGHLPIVVPRDPARGEHVDNHQQLFARRMAAAGLVHLCESEPELTTALDLGVADPARFSLDGDAPGGAGRAEAVARVGRIVEELVDARVRRRTGRLRR